MIQMVKLTIWYNLVLEVIILVIFSLKLYLFFLINFNIYCKTIVIFFKKKKKVTRASYNICKGF